MIFWLALLPGTNNSPKLVISVLFTMASFFCAGLAAVRLRRLPGKLWGGWWQELGYALELTAGLALITSALLYATNHWDLLFQSHLGRNAGPIIVLLCAPGFLLSRAVMRLIWAWNELRSTRYLWGIMHSILVVVAIVGFLIIVVLFIGWYVPSITPEIPADTQFTQVVIWSFTILFISIGLVIGGLVLIFPLAALVSFLVARNTTRRIETLSEAVSRMQHGDLKTRIMVKGKDEVAQLQNDFNQMAAELQESTKALKEEKEKVTLLLQSQRNLTAEVSHELRTPVATILGYLEELENHWQDQSPKEVKQKLNATLYESNRMKEILNDLLTLSQTEANSLSFHLKPIDIIPIIDSIVDRLSPLAWRLRRIQITKQTDGQTVIVITDLQRLEQVLINLIQNGVRHTPPGGLVSVAVHSEPDHAVIEVSDNGEGIPDADQSRIWDKYYRAKDAEKQKSTDNSQTSEPENFLGSGYGLGLSIVKELVEGMGGKITLQSKPGEGCTFRISLKTDHCDKTATNLRKS